MYCVVLILAVLLAFVLGGVSAIAAAAYLYTRQWAQDFARWCDCDGSPAPPPAHQTGIQP